MMQYVTTEGTQGICPAGWHLPTDGEWTELTTYLGGRDIAGGKMKETGTAHWALPNTGATNSSKFTALPGGTQNVSGNFSSLVSSAVFWSSTEVSTVQAWFRILSHGHEGVDRVISLNGKMNGYSCRCLIDN